MCIRDRLYKPRDPYRPKVEVCQEYIQTYGDCQVVVEVHQRLFTAEDRITTPVVISAVDNQDARRIDVYKRQAISCE